MKKLALCFRSVGIDHRRGDDRDDVVVVAVSNKRIVSSEEHKHRKMVPAAASVGAGIGSSEFSCRPCRLKTGSRKPFSRIIKPTLFTTSPRIMGEIKTDQKVAIKVQQEVSPTSKAISSISPKPEFARSRSNSLEKKPKPTKLISSKEKSSILYVIVVLSLFVTVMFNKYLAILFTSLSLYVVPMVFNADYCRRLRNDAVVMEMETGIDEGAERKRIEELLWKGFYTISRSIKSMTR